MSYLKDLAIFCLNEGLDFESYDARRRFETGASDITIRDGHPLTMDEIDALTGGLVGRLNVCCPYCGVPGKNNMKIERPSLMSATWHCFYCGRDGEARGEGPIDRKKEAEAKLRAEVLKKEKKAESQAKGLAIWWECVPIKDGDPVRRYLEARGIFDLPQKVDEVLRFHPRCPFGPGTRKLCLVALMRDVLTDEPQGVLRTVVNEGIHPPKMAMGPNGRAAVKLWPLDGDRLVIGEGIETVLSAASRIEWREPLRPAWALMVARNVANFPVIGSVQRLRILVDNDESGTGQDAAECCAAMWGRASKEVIRLTPPPGMKDFNDGMAS